MLNCLSLTKLGISRLYVAALTAIVSSFVVNEHHARASTRTCVQYHIEPGRVCCNGFRPFLPNAGNGKNVDQNHHDSSVARFCCCFFTPRIFVVDSCGSNTRSCVERVFHTDQHPAHKKDLALFQLRKCCRVSMEKKVDASQPLAKGGNFCLLFGVVCLRV